MERPGDLQTGPDLIGKAASIADQHRVDNRGRKRTVRRNAIDDDMSDVGPHFSREFADDGGSANDLNQQSALDGSKERNSIESGIALKVWNAVVQKTRGTAEDDRRFEDAAATPLCDARLTWAAADAEHCASVCRHPGTVWPNCDHPRS